MPAPPSARERKTSSNDGAIPSSLVKAIPAAPRIPRIPSSPIDRGIVDDVEAFAEAVEAHDPGTRLAGRPPRRPGSAATSSAIPPRMLRTSALRRVRDEDAAFVEEGDRAAAGGLVHVGRREQDRRAARVEVQEEAPELPPRNGVDAGRRLVEEEDLRLVEEVAGEGELFLHPAGEIPAEAVLIGSRGR